MAYRTKGVGVKFWKNEQEMISSIEDSYGIRVLPVNKEHMRTYANLEINLAQGHKDPSDHIIICHAMTENLTLISSDSRFPFYRKQGLDLIENKR